MNILKAWIFGIDKTRRSASALRSSVFRKEPRPFWSFALYMLLPSSVGIRLRAVQNCDQSFDCTGTARESGAEPSGSESRLKTVEFFRICQIVPMSAFSTTLIVELPQGEGGRSAG